MSREKNIGRLFEDLLEVMSRLRRDCPWDRVQDAKSLRPYLLEEAHEVLEALDGEDRDAYQEELGDLLFQVVFHAELAAEAGWFGMDDILVTLTRKMIDRHPHVFGGASAGNPAEALDNWEAAKQREHLEVGRSGERGRRGRKRSRLDGVPKTMPALLRAARLGEKAARIGFDWENPKQVMNKVREELKELESALEQGDARACAQELGDMLFTLAQLGRHLEESPEMLLRSCCAKFISRFQYIESKLKGNLKVSPDIDYLERLWKESKRAVKETT